MSGVRPSYSTYCDRLVGHAQRKLAPRHLCSCVVHYRCNAIPPVNNLQRRRSAVESSSGLFLRQGKAHLQVIPLGAWNFAPCRSLCVATKTHEEVHRLHTMILSRDSLWSFMNAFVLRHVACLIFAQNHISCVVVCQMCHSVTPDAPARIRTRSPNDKDR